MGNTPSGEAKGTESATTNKDNTNDIKKLFGAHIDSDIDKVLDLVISNSEINIDRDTKEFIKKYYEKTSEASAKKIEYFTEPIKNKKKELIASINNRKNIDGREKEQLLNIVENVLDTSVRYKSLEYNYIELNVFLIGFLYNVYTLLDNYQANISVITTNKNTELLEVLKEMSVMNPKTEGNVTASIEKLEKEQSNLIRKANAESMNQMTKLLENNGNVTGNSSVVGAQSVANQ